MVGVVRWFLSTLYGSYAARWNKGGNEKKPYNPVLGELFFVDWEYNNSKIDLICEQGKLDILFFISQSAIILQLQASTLKTGNHKRSW